MMRNLIEKRRAAPLDSVGDEELAIIQSFIVNENDDIFRTILEYVIEQHRIR